MKLRHAAALALVGWYLMAPPIRQTKDDGRYIDEHAEYRDWSILSTFPDRDQCEEFRDRGVPDAEQQLASGRKKGPRLGLNQLTESECIATDDPRLKGK
jgi:hypothetical protein